MAEGSNSNGLATRLWQLGLAGASVFVAVVIGLIGYNVRLLTAGVDVRFNAAADRDAAFEARLAAISERLDRHVELPTHPVGAVEFRNLEANQRGENDRLWHDVRKLIDDQQQLVKFVTEEMRAVDQRINDLRTAEKKP